VLLDLDAIVLANLIPGVMMMRAYAFTGRNKKILIGLSFGYIILIAVNLGVFITEDDLPSASFYKLIGHTGCYPAYDGMTVANLGVSFHH
jgi:hypothetical protein